jgi:hypothetical protein
MAAGGWEWLNILTPIQVKEKSINIKQEAGWNIQVAWAFWVVLCKANVHFG